MQRKKKVGKKEIVERREKTERNFGYRYRMKNFDV